MAVFFAALFLAVDFFAGAFFAVDFAAVVFLAGAFLAVDDFFAAVLAGAFFAADVFLAVDVFLAGVDFAAVFFAVDLVVAGAFFAVDFVADAFLAVDDFLAGAADFLVVDVAFLAGEVAAATVSRGSFFAPDTTFFRSWPGVNFGTLLRLVRMFSPVRGLRAVLAARTLFSNEPKPVIATFSPLATSRVIVSSTDSRA